MIIRRAAFDDCEGICRAHVGSIRAVCAGSGLYSAAEIEAWAGPKSAADYRGLIEKYEFFVLEAEGRIVGFGELDPCAPADELGGEAEVRGLYFAPVGRGRGWGYAMMAHLEARARGWGVASVRVDGTLNAVPFYERCGYREQRRSTHRLRSGVELACVRMLKTLEPTGEADRDARLSALARP